MNEEYSLEDFANNLLDMTTRCRSCMSCYSVCPLVESTHGFSTQGPYGILRSIYHGIKRDFAESLTVQDKQVLRNILYSCTTCGACDIKCKTSGAGVPIVELIESGRKLLVDEMVGPLKNQNTALKSIWNRGNPYGMPAADRLGWLKNLSEKESLSCKIVPDDGEVDLLLYVGCTASYEKSIQNVARSLVTLLEHMKINYGILKEEECCGSPANRIGDNQLFSDVFYKNTKKFVEYGVKHIITISPHCYNTFVNEYPDSMKEIKIQHYTEFLSDMMEDGRLDIAKEIAKKVTYHDPCYLGKKNNIYDAPRKLLRGIPAVNLVEMKRNRQDSLCCGGGGGRMWDEVEEVTRLSEIRLGEAMDADAEIIATACPWCHIQLHDAVQDTNNESKIVVKDIAEILVEAL